MRIGRAMLCRCITPDGEIRPGTAAVTDRLLVWDVSR